MEEAEEVTLLEVSRKLNHRDGDKEKKKDEEDHHPLLEEPVVVQVYPPA